jgi:hypothetical protein
MQRKARLGDSPQIGPFTNRLCEEISHEIEVPAHKERKIEVKAA